MMMMSNIKIYRFNQNQMKIKTMIIKKMKRDRKNQKYQKLILIIW